MYMCLYACLSICPRVPVSHRGKQLSVRMRLQTGLPIFGILTVYQRDWASASECVCGSLLLSLRFSGPCQGETGD